MSLLNYSLDGVHIFAGFLTLNVVQQLLQPSAGVKGAKTLNLMTTIEAKEESW